MIGATGSLQNAAQAASLSAGAQASGVGGPQALGNLRASAQKDPKSAIKEVAKQFEALFMQELMKSMRATTMATGALDGGAGGTGEMATQMLDTQYATQMSGRSGGLADAIARQLERQMGSNVGAATPAGSVPTAQRFAPSAAAVGSSGATSASAGTPAASAFVRQHSQAAERVAAESGIPAAFMLGQAAHETGWGRRTPVGSDGRDSNNLFGIKAGANWKGPVVEASTTEVIDGQAVKVKARFRAYDSPEASFRDYAKLIATSPRYAGVMAGVTRAGSDAQSFAQGLQKAGYATDPQYAAKLGRVIDTAARLQQVVT